ncbi:MAG TPA: biotin/lipoyl-binding protein, partial [Anaerolineaceae bacterium]|nr:biotin/lipoyl-binding protein [Anaerolineaceae bacterium]
MTPEKKKLKITWQKIVFPVAAVLIVAAAGLVYSYITQKNSVAAQAATTDTFNTAKVRQGDLTISATGSGALAAGKTVALSFPTSGKVGSLSVQVGDEVTAGQELASLQNIDALKASLSAAELNLTLAKQTLADLHQNASTNLVNAQYAVWDAQTALNSTKNLVKKSGVTRCDEDTIEAYYEAYAAQKDNYAKVVEADNGNPYYYLNQITAAKEAMDEAETAYEYCLKYTDYEIETSQADLTLAEATLAQAQAELELLQANDGVDPTELAQAQSDIANAEIAYNEAKANVDGAVLTASINGTILSVGGEVGDPVGTDTFITVIDLYHPVV